MRCPECRQNTPDTANRCQSCGYGFVFQPANDLVDDATLRQCMDELSNHGEWAFTPLQLALRLLRHNRRQPPYVFLLIATVVATLLLGAAFELPGRVLLILSVLDAVLVLGAVYFVNKTRKPTLSLAQAKSAVRRYHAEYPITELAEGRDFLETDTPDASELARRAALDDMLKHGFIPERILIVERSEWVDVMIRNKQHMQERMMIVTQDGYPHMIYQACVTFLHNNPNLPVFLLHDASQRNDDFENRLRHDQRWPLAEHPITDLGLKPSQLRSQKDALPWLSGGGQLAWRSVSSQRYPEHNARMPVDAFAPGVLQPIMSAALAASGVLAFASYSAVASGMEVEMGDDYG